MTRTFLVPIDVDSGDPAELVLLAGEIGDAITAAGLSLAGEVHPWSPQGLIQPPSQLLQPNPQPPLL